MKQKLTLLTACIFCSMMSYAQIGYQVSLLNSATGEPRANETVSVSVTITNSEDTQIFSSTQSATTNDFGVLSLQIGNSTTFDNVDWSKLPFFISATVDGVMVGKSQILNVPVAEAAKRRVDISLDDLCDKNWGNSYMYYRFNRNGTCYWYAKGDIYSGIYYVSENLITTTLNGEIHALLMIGGKLYRSLYVYTYAPQI